WDGMRSGGRAEDNRSNSTYGRCRHAHPGYSVPGFATLGCERCRRLLPVPGHGALQTFFEAYAGAVAQVFLCPGDIGKGVLDIAGALRTMLHRTLVSGNRAKQGDGLVEGGLVSGGHVENAS